MIEERDGKTAVKCDECGEVIEHCGWMPEVKTPKRTYVMDNEHYCDECFGKVQPMAVEFRICDECGHVMREGFCDEWGDHVCEECWDGFIARHFPDGFEAIPDEEQEEYDDFYRAYDKKRGEWYVTSWYWTQWD